MSINKNEIHVDIFSGPKGSCGFRRGTWTATYRGKIVEFFASIPHACSLSEQKELLLEVAARAIILEDSK